MTRPIPWTEPIEDLKMPLRDSAWALNALEAKDEAEMQAKGVESVSKDKKAIRPNRSADKKTTCFDHSDGGGVKNEDDEDEDEYDEDSQHNDLEDEDDEDQIDNVSHGPSSLKPVV